LQCAAVCCSVLQQTKSAPGTYICWTELNLVETLDSHFPSRNIEFNLVETLSLHHVRLRELTLPFLRLSKLALQYLRT